MTPAPAVVDLAILGGGSAASAAALHATDLGATVAVIESGSLGGTCVNAGCVPSKALIRAAGAHHAMGHHPFAGIGIATDAVEWAGVRAQKDALVGELRQAKYLNVLRDRENLILVPQHGRLAGPSAIDLADGSRLAAGRILLATGAAPAAPQIPGLAAAGGGLDSASAMTLDQLPRHLLLLGGGFVGVELGQMFARLGVAVTLMTRSDRVLRHEDPEVGHALTGCLRAEGLEVLTGAAIERVDRTDRGYRIAMRIEGAMCHREGDELLVATGRTPRTAGLGLERAGVHLGPEGQVAVDEFLASSAPGIFAAGDVTGGPMFVYVAAHQGALAAANALGESPRPVDLRVVPRVTFTDPAVASVGVTEAEARARGITPLVTRLPLVHVPQAIVARDTRGFIKLVADAGNRRILGAQILAREAGEMILEPTLAIRFGLTIEDLVSTLHPYLTLAEGIKLAAQSFDRDISRLSCCAA